MMTFIRWLKGAFMTKVPAQRPWTVDRDGRIRTDKHRPVVLRARMPEGRHG